MEVEEQAQAAAADSKKRSAEEAFERDCESLAASMADPEFLKHVSSADTSSADRTAAMRKILGDKFRAAPYG